MLSNYSLARVGVDLAASFCSFRQRRTARTVLECLNATIWASLG